ncbi:hypothetical protein E2562_023239 [Oryza meyeriana var. granulata]|uniref:Proteasome endopeptidase complex n=1 Tax=Oryza meyeriana var. granulata TaxID=110450 RepID=A0A6G1DLX4_9ORYZ|nr:hypothetical protein E2562_023239 [Oryza meyeriana var. granulata]
MEPSAQRYALAYQEPIPVEQLVQSLCDTKQGYTQFGGLRPFGVSFLFAGWDKHHGFQLYMSDPSGNYSGWKAAAVGANSQTAQYMLKQDYRDGLTRKEAVALALKLELAEVFLQPGTGEVQYQVCSPEALGKLLAKSGLTQPTPEARCAGLLCVAWPGVTCDSGGRVTAVQVGNRSLTGKLAPEARNLTALARLELFKNSIFDELPNHSPNQAV